MQRNNWVPASILAVALLVGGGVVFSRAEGGKEARAGMDAVASVDMEKIFAASDAPKTLAEASLNFERQATEQIRAIASVPYLSPAELTEFAGIVAVAMQTEAQKARAKELKELSDSRHKRRQELSTKKPLLPEEEKFLNEMAQRERGLQQALPRIQQDMQGNEAQLLQNLRREQMAKLGDMVEKIAKDKGFTHVFDSSSLVYSVNDVTAAVIQKMPKPKN
jgi:Skp family chaperone for outer membrane proteins